MIATARNLESLGEIKTMGAYTMSLDVTASVSDISEKINAAVKEHGPITHLVNSAGYMLEGMVEECIDLKHRRSSWPV